MHNKQRAAVEILVAFGFLLSLFLLAYFSISMERPRGWPTAPGLFPFLICVFGVIFFSLIMLSGIRKGGLNLDTLQQSRDIKIWLSGPNTNRVVKFGFIVAGYYFLFLPLLPFECATLIFLMLTQVLFSTGLVWSKALLISISITLTVSIIFRGFFGILLPGSFDLLDAFLFELERI